MIRDLYETADEEAEDSQLPPSAVAAIKATRLPSNPLITPVSSPTLGDNINGPSLIRVPDWIEAPLGRYYLYFANHSGKHIRLAYADALEGPWTIHEPGILPLSEAPLFDYHIASPDVHIDHPNQQILMYVHGPSRQASGQHTALALSRDGLDFTLGDELLGKFYFRVWQWRDAWYALAKDWNSGWGRLYCSPDGRQSFEDGGPFLRRVRHTAVLVQGHHLLIFYSRKGDAPERILLSTVDLRPDWREWQPSQPLEVLRPEAPYEGIEYPNEPSSYGSATNVRQLRDPGIFAEDGKLLLIYSYAGEMGLAAAWLDIQLKPD